MSVVCPLDLVANSTTLILNKTTKRRGGTRELHAQYYRTFEPSRRFSSKVNTWGVAAGIVKTYRQSRIAKLQQLDALNSQP
jgi:hypothetical protein